jgi:hypothetical protein
VSGSECLVDDRDWTKKTEGRGSTIDQAISVLVNVGRDSRERKVIEVENKHIS